jgi:hypothetical protein
MAANAPKGFTYENRCGKTVQVLIEPWGEELRLDAGESVDIEFDMYENSVDHPSVAIVQEVDHVLLSVWVNIIRIKSKWKTVEYG